MHTVSAVAVCAFVVGSSWHCEGQHKFTLGCGHNLKFLRWCKDQQQQQQQSKARVFKDIKSVHLQLVEAHIPTALCASDSSQHSHEE
jgi:hypothetical protein